VQAEIDDGHVDYGVVAPSLQIAARHCGANEPYEPTLREKQMTIPVIPDVDDWLIKKIVLQSNIFLFCKFRLQDVMIGQGKLLLVCIVTISMSNFSDDQDRALVRLVTQQLVVSRSINWDVVTKKFSRLPLGKCKTKLALRTRLATLKRTHGKDVSKFPKNFFYPPNASSGNRETNGQVPVPTLQQPLTQSDPRDRAHEISHLQGSRKTILEHFEDVISDCTTFVRATTMNTHDVYVAIDDIFSTIRRADIRQPPGIRALNSGEVLPVGVTTMIAVMCISTRDIFVDIGSGTGSLLAQIALQTSVTRCIGLEIRSALADQSRAVIKASSHRLPNLTKVAIECGDIKNLSAAARDKLLYCTVIFCNNMVFEPTDNQAVADFILSSNTVRLVLLTERFWGRCIGDRCAHAFCHIWLLEKTMQIEVSWTARRINMYVYHRRNTHRSSNALSLLEAFDTMFD
jgi:SAM-dependent methyltransferase